MARTKYEIVSANIFVTVGGVLGKPRMLDIDEIQHLLEIAIDVGESQRLTPTVHFRERKNESGASELVAETAMKWDSNGNYIHYPDTLRKFNVASERTENPTTIEATK